MSMTFATDIEASGSRHVGTANNRFTFNGPGQPIYYVVGPSTDTTAGTWTGTIDGLTAYYEGLTVFYRPVIAGASTTTLNINGLGAKTCYYNGTSKLTTHYAVGSIIPLTFYSDSWRTAEYDANTNTLVRVYRQTTGYNADYPLIASRTQTIGTAGSNSSYTAVYGVIGDTNIPTVNPQTGLVKFKGLTVTDKITGSISGDAATVNGLSVQTAVPANAKFTDTTYESKAAASGGTAVSLVTTGEKYTWNNKSNLAIGTTASTAMAGNTTVTNVAISANTTTNANYPVVFATSNTGTTAAKNEGVQKSGAKFYFNPSTGALNTDGTINGVDLANVVTDAGYQLYISGSSLGQPENKAMTSLVKSSSYPHQMCYYSSYIHEEAVVSAAAGSWTTATPPTQTISVTGIGNITSSLVEVGLASTATSEEIDAAAAAKIMCTAQAASSITLTCYGTTPTINIPILVVNWG